MDETPTTPTPPEASTPKHIKKELRPWQKDGPVPRSMTMVSELFSDPEKTPRLARAVYLPMDDKEDATNLLAELRRDPALPAILMKMGESSSRGSAAFAPALRFPNVRVTDVLGFLVQSVTAFDGPRGLQDKHATLRAMTERLRSTIRHDLGNALRSENDPSRAATLLSRARTELGLQGTDEDVTAAVMTKDALPETGAFTDIPAVAVDWDGTLWLDGQLDEGFLEHAREVAASHNLPLFIWTGGSVDDVYRALAAAGVTDLNVCAKQDCAGLRVSFAIDDKPIEELRAEYGLDATDSQLISTEET